MELTLVERTLSPLAEISSKLGVAELVAHVGGGEIGLLVDTRGSNRMSRAVQGRFASIQKIEVVLVQVLDEAALGKVSVSKTNNEGAVPTRSRGNQLVVQGGVGVLKALLPELGTDRLAHLTKGKSKGIFQKDRKRNKVILSSDSFSVSPMKICHK